LPRRPRGKLTEHAPHGTMWNIDDDAAFAEIVAI
jgi:hypothetical protein